MHNRTLEASPLLIGPEMALHSYVVRYDSGFAPNPFYGYCTLATCKPDIRRTAELGDWIVGSGSDARKVRRGGYLVYAMRVTEDMTFEQYDADPRFAAKKPYRSGSRKQSCGDNIYYRDAVSGAWMQRDSFHSRDDGSPYPDHVKRDTGVNRVLISNDFVYFGGYGPKLPGFRDTADRVLCKSGIGQSRFDYPVMVEQFCQWLANLGVRGYQDAPFEWRALRG